MRTLFVILTLMVLSFNCDAQRTTRKNLKLKEEYTTTVKGDTIKNPSTDILKISGYDKPLNSNKETFFVTNNGEGAIVKINITFNYFDNQNRQLHSATRNISCAIPPGETRQLSISSWDKQKAFYYYRSPQPRRQATPYKVSHNINYIITPKRPLQNYSKETKNTTNCDSSYITTFFYNVDSVIIENFVFGRILLSNTSSYVLNREDWTNNKSRTSNRSLNESDLITLIQGVNNFVINKTSIIRQKIKRKDIFVECDYYTFINVIVYKNGIIISEFDDTIGVERGNSYYIYDERFLNWFNLVWELIYNTNPFI